MSDSHARYGKPGTSKSLTNKAPTLYWDEHIRHSADHTSYKRHRHYTGVTTEDMALIQPSKKGPDLILAQTPREWRQANARWKAPTSSREIHRAYSPAQHRDETHQAETRTEGTDLTLGRQPLTPPIRHMAPTSCQDDHRE